MSIMAMAGSGRSDLLNVNLLQFGLSPFFSGLKAILDNHNHMRSPQWPLGHNGSPLV